MIESHLQLSRTLAVTHYVLTGKRVSHSKFFSFWTTSPQDQSVCTALSINLEEVGP
jgi:hypothetical protein